MRKVIATTLATTALLVLAAGPAAIAQTAGAGASAGTSTSSGPAPNKEASGSAPVGHRQPRADQVPPEKDLGNGVSREDAAIDRRIKSICRGC